MAKIAAAELTQEQIAAIDNYGDNITTMKDFVSICRRRPGFLIGDIHENGYLNMMREIFQNSIDQLMDKESPCNEFSFFYDMRTLEVEVRDNGKGFPFDDMVRILTKEYTSQNYEKKLGQYSSGMHGCGAKVVIALSETAVVKSYRYDGKAKILEFSKGYPLYENPKDIPNKDKFQGSMVKFTPDLDIMGDINLDWKVPYKLIKQIMSITPIGSAMTFTAIDMDGVEHNERIVNRDGIITDLIMRVKNPIIKPITFGFDDGTHKIEAAFTYDGGDDKNPPDFNPHCTSFSNFCPTKSGTHIDGTIDGIVRWFSNYMNKVYLINQKAKDKTVVTAPDIRTGLNLMVAAAHLEPIFSGQAKEILTNDDMIPFCKEVVMKSLDEWSKSNPGDLAKLSKYFKDIAEIRMKTDKEKVKIVTKYQENTLTGLPAKYSRPKGKCEELILVEGDSAGGTAKVAKGPNQGIFPLRGKVPSAFEKSKQDFWNNAEIQGIARIILGHPYTGKNFDINDVVWDKIIFMADADVDGSHIASLLLRYFILYMPQLIEAGKVYKAIPPLYSTTGNNNKITYFTDRIEFVKYVQKVFINQNKITDIKSKQPLSSRDMTLLFMNNEDYVYELESLATTYAVEPKLLEMALYAYIHNKKLSDVAKKLKSEFRFMNVTQDKKGNFLFDGTIKESNFLYTDQKLINDCSKIIKIINKNRNLYYLLNGKEASIYDIMKAFEACTPPRLQRYKGLGEMNEDQLAVSTLLPDSDRMLIRYTLEDLKEELGIIREYESDRSKLLDLVGNIRRVDLLD